MSIKTVVITGGAGFVGSHLCEAFLKKGRRVICVDNFVTGSRQNIRPFLSQRNFSFIHHDISEKMVLKDPVHFVLHFASPASPPDYLHFPIETLKVGSLGTLNALNLALEKKAVFLLASTSEIYGDPLVSPQKESYWGHVNPVGPRSVYDEAKRFSEAITTAYHRTHGLDAKIIRIFNTYGERMRIEDGRVIPNFICQALQNKPLTVYGDGNQTRSYCYVADLVKGVEKVLFSSLNQPVNLGNPNEMSVLRLARHILKLTGSKSKIVHKPLPVDDPKQRCPDITLAKKSLDWCPEVSLGEGLPRTISYFRASL